MGAAGGEDAVADSRTDGLTGEITRNDEAAGVQVQRVGIIGKAQGLIIGVGVEGDGVGIVGVRTGTGTGDDEGSVGQAEILGDAARRGDDRGVIAPVTCAAQTGEAARGIAGGRFHIAGEGAAVRRPGDDAVDQEATAVGDDEAVCGTHLAGGISVEQGGEVALGEVAGAEDRGADGTVGAGGDGEVVLRPRQGDGAHGFRAIPEIATRQSQVAAAHGDRGGIVDPVAVGHRASIVKAEDGVVDRDGRGAGKTPFIKQGERSAADHRTARIGVIAEERHGPRPGLIEGDISCAGGDIATPCVLGIDADEGRGRRSNIVHHDAATASEGGGIGRTQEAGHLAVAVQVESGTWTDCEMLAGRTTLSTLPERVLTGGQSNGTTIDGEEARAGVEILLRGESQVAAQTLGDVLSIKEGRVDGEIGAGVDQEGAFS